jgi:hypothetical protein
MKKADLGSRAPNPRPRQPVGQFLRQILAQSVPPTNSPANQRESAGNAAERPATDTADSPGDELCLCGHRHEQHLDGCRVILFSYRQFGRVLDIRCPCSFFKGRELAP